MIYFLPPGFVHFPSNALPVRQLHRDCWTIWIVCKIRIYSSCRHKSGSLDQNCYLGVSQRMDPSRLHWVNQQLQQRRHKSSRFSDRVWKVRILVMQLTFRNNYFLSSISRRSDNFFIDDRSLGDIGNYDFVNGPEASLALSSKLVSGCNSTMPISPDHIRQVKLHWLYQHSTKCSIIKICSMFKI